MLSKGCFLAIDFGTSAVRAVVSRGFTGIENSARKPLNFFRPADGPDTAWELDPNEAWQTTCEVVKKCLSSGNIKPSDVGGIGVTSQRFGMVLLDDCNNAIRICPNRDARSAFSAGAVAVENVDLLDSMRETRPAMLSSWAKLLWFREEMPELFKTVHSAVSIADWICLQLTDNLTCELSLAVDASVAKFDTGEKSDKLLKTLGLSNINFPQICFSGTVVGETKNTELGLRTGVPVISCGADTQNALIGMGVFEDGDLGVVSGWSMSAQRVIPEPIGLKAEHLWIGRHVVPSKWVLEANMGEIGGAYDWLCRLLMGESSTDALDTLEKESSKNDPYGSGVCMRLSEGHTAMTRIPGLGLGGITFPVPLSFEPPDRGQIVWSALEGFAFILKDAVEELGKATGGVSSVSFAGGMTRNRLFTRISANALGVPVQVDRTTEASALGALAITYSALKGESVAECAELLRLQLETVYPDENTSAVLETSYLEWKERFGNLSD